ncbi:hypothetical protein D3C73_583110 [compost metagenome]
MLDLILGAVLGCFRRLVVEQRDDDVIGSLRPVCHLERLILVKCLGIFRQFFVNLLRFVFVSRQGLLNLAIRLGNEVFVRAGDVLAGSRNILRQIGCGGVCSNNLITEGFVAFRLRILGWFHEIIKTAGNFLKVCLLAGTQP